MTEKTAVLSDIHGNRPALEAVLADIRSTGCSRLFFIGDLVNGIDPQGCVDLMRSWDGAVCLNGNAEWYMFTPDQEILPHAFVPVEEIQDYKHLIHFVQWFKQRLSPDALEWLAQLPSYAIWNDICFVHDSPQDRLVPQNWHRPGLDEKYQEFYFHSRGIPAQITAAEAISTFDFLRIHNCSHVFIGHTHVPFIYTSSNGSHDANQKQWICNVGSAGAPLDADPRPSWALMDENRQVSIRRVEYDIQQTLDLVDQTPDFPNMGYPGYIAAYKKWLASGVHWRDHLR